MLEFQEFIIIVGNMLKRVAQNCQNRIFVLECDIYDYTSSSYMFDLFWVMRVEFVLGSLGRNARVMNF